MLWHSLTSQKVISNFLKNSSWTKFIMRLFDDFLLVKSTSCKCWIDQFPHYFFRSRLLNTDMMIVLEPVTHSFNSQLLFINLCVILSLFYLLLHYHFFNTVSFWIMMSYYTWQIGNITHILQHSVILFQNLLIKFLVLNCFQRNYHS